MMVKTKRHRSRDKSTEVMDGKHSTDAFTLNDFQHKLSEQRRVVRDLLSKQKSCQNSVLGCFWLRHIAFTAFDSVCLNSRLFVTFNIQSIFYRGLVVSFLFHYLVPRNFLKQQKKNLHYLPEVSFHLRLGESQRCLIRSADKVEAQSKLIEIIM